MATFDQSHSLTETIGLGEIISILLERVWIIVLCTALCLIGGYAYVKRSPKIYSAQTLLFVEAKKNVVNIQEVSHENLRSYDVMQTNLQLIRSKPLLARVAKKLDLAHNANFWGKFYNPEKIPSDEATTNFLSSIVFSSLREGTTLIDVRVEHQIPTLAQKVANEISREFILKNIEDRSTASEVALEFLFKQADKMNTELLQSEQNAHEYREKSKTTSIDSETFDDLNRRFNEVRKSRMMLEADLNEIQKSGNDSKRLLVLRTINEDPSVKNLINSMEKKQEEAVGLSQRFTEAHPKVIQARGELSSLSASLNNAVFEAARNVYPRYMAESAQEKHLESMIGSRSRESIEYKALNRELDSNREIYKTLVTRIKETEVTKALEADDIKIVEEALLPRSPVKPNVPKIMLASFVGGLFLSFTLAFGLNFLDTSIKSPDQIESQLKLPVLTVVPEAKIVSKGTKEDLNSAARESFRSLVVSLKLLGRKEDARSFLFTSALPAEGKTYCSYHCAVQLASQGHKTLLIDADLRKPLLHELVPNGKLEQGLSELLAQQMSFADVVRQTPIENLSFISAGSRSPNPPKLLANKAFATVMQAALQYFDFVLVDSAPINAVADTLLLAEHVQKICLIARAGVTPEKALVRAVQSLTGSAEKQPAGFILNRYKSRRGLYYYYNYSYHKSYGYYGAYGENSETST